MNILPDLVDMLSFGSLFIELFLEVDGAEHSGLDMAGVDFEAECAEAFEVHTLKKFYINIAKLTVMLPCRMRGSL